MKPTLGYRKFKDCHKGETMLLVATGPGLYNIPLHFLTRYPSIGCNRIHLHYDKTGFAPTYYIDLGLNHLVTPEQIEYVIPMLSDDQVVASFTNRFTAHRLPFEDAYGILGCQYYGEDPTKKMVFSIDPLDIMGVATQIPYPMLQILFYMGAQTVLIVGMDGYYDLNSSYKHFYSDEEQPLWGKAPGSRITVDQLYEQADKSFKLANEIYEKEGRRIVNLSEPTGVDVFEKGKWQDWENWE